MSSFQVGDLVVRCDRVYKQSPSKSLWKVTFTFSEAVEVVPLRNGKELKMLTKIYGDAMFRPATESEIAAGHRIA